MNAESKIFDESAQVTLIHAFDATVLDPAGFHHRDHVQLTWALLHRKSLQDAIGHIREGLKRFVALVGRPDRYHETITVFYTMQIHARMAHDESWEAFADRNPDLLGPTRDFLLRFYDEATLASDLAKCEFVPPGVVLRAGLPGCFTTPGGDVANNAQAGIEG